MSEETSTEQTQLLTNQELDVATERFSENHETAGLYDSQALSTTVRIKIVLKRIFSYYYRWPVVLAVLAIALNCASTIEGMPLRWLLTSSSTVLILMLVGHSGTRADKPLQEIRTLAEHSQAESDDARQKAANAQKKVTKAFQRSRKAVIRAKDASAVASESLKTANIVSKVAHTANHLATSALQTSLSSKRLSDLSRDKSQQAENSSKIALDRGQLAITKANQSLQRAEIAVNQSKAATNQSKLAVANTEANFNKTFQVLKRINVNNVRLFQPFNRYLEEEVLEELTDVWMPKLNISINPRALGYLAHRICLIEDTCSGRLAANVESMLLRVLVARSVESKTLSVLEIGSLFGINLGILYESCQGYFQSIRLTALDPLDGYYGQSQFDTITEVPVSRQIFEHNMRRLDIPSQDVTLIQDLSTQDKVVEQVNQNRYNLLVIDGDHSYEGVQFDFDHYLNCVESGGYIIFDDYESEYWPAIATFVDEKVKPDPRVTFIGSGWKTAVFRVKSD